MNIRNTFLLLGLLVVSAPLTLADEPKAPKPPNVVLILTDNQGAWTLGCYGNPDIKTPNIDRLATQGMRFTRAFCPNGVCSPTRASLLTGLIPSQHGVHCYLGANEAQMGPNAYCTIAEFRSLPEILAESGYTCGLSGKWHLGANETPQEGFSSWITMPQGHTSTFYGAQVIEEGKVRQEPGYLTDLWTDRAVRFLEQNRDRPFFLYLAYNGPYNLGASLNHPGQNRHVEQYADDPLLSFPRDGVHPWQHDNKAFLNNIVAMRRVAVETSGVDDGVGTIMETLDRLKLTDNTIVIYTADQGWVGGQNGLWGMSDHTRPLSAFDGMMHIPLIVRHPGHVPAGSTSDLMVSGYDLMSTLLHHLGLGNRMPETPKPPGATSPPLSRASPSPGTTPSSSRTRTFGPSAPRTGSTSTDTPTAPSSSTTWPTTPARRSTSTASPATTRSSRTSTTASTPSSTNTPTLATTSTTRVDRRLTCSPAPENHASCGLPR